jgi:hypothetical protein
MADEHDAMNADVNEGEDEQMLDQQAQQGAPLPKKKKRMGKKGGLQDRASAARSRALQQLKLMKAYRAGIAAAAAANFPRSHPIPVQTMEEMDAAETAAAAAAAAGAEATGAEGGVQTAPATQDQTTQLVGELVSMFRTVAGRGGNGQAEGTRTHYDKTKVIGRPSYFDGTGQFHEWKNEVQMYLQVMRFPPEEEADVVQSCLRGTALAWWIQKLQKMAADGVNPPRTYLEFLPYLNERFEHRNPELAARDRLMALRQNNMTLHQYLREFEGCYAYIPKWDEADKIHRFMYGLKPYYRTRFCVDPATHQWWTSFDALVAYISAYLSDDVSGRADDAERRVAQVFGDAAPHLQTKNGQQKNKGRPNKGFPHKLAQLMGRLKGDDRAILQQIIGGRVQKRTKPGSGDKTVSYRNANGESVVRTKAVRTFCHKTNPGLCLGCYQPGHMVADCRNPVARGNPEGFRAPGSRE